MDQLTDRVVIVTGGARGLGAATCRALARAGAIAIAADVRADIAKELAAEIAHSGGRADAVALDVSDADQVGETIRSINDQYGSIDAVINNAGIDLTVSIEEISPADWDRIIAVNLRGPFLMSKTALSLMRAQGHGHIVNIVSTASKRTWPKASAYHASKWGLLGFSHALHTEARPYGVKVTAVVAGGMRTPFLLERFPDIDVATLQDPINVADTIVYVLGQPPETVIPEVMVIPMTETSWP